MDYEDLTPEQRKQIADDLDNDIKELMSTGSFDPSKIFADGHLNLNPGGDDIELFDYDSIISNIKEYTAKTIKDLANYHLKGYEDIAATLLERIIEDHVEQMALYDFLVWHNRRQLIDISNEIDRGAKDSRLYDSSVKLKKEFRETLKTRNEEFKNIKEFYSKHREELEKRFPREIKEDAADFTEEKPSEGSNFTGNLMDLIKNINEAQTVINEQRDSIQQDNNK